MPELDRVPPEPPTGLTATAGDGQVALAWTPSISTDVTGYAVERRKQGTDRWDDIASVSGRVTSTAVDRSVTNGTTYEYRVAAVDGSLNEAYSEVVVATPQASLPASGRIQLIEWTGMDENRLEAPSSIATNRFGEVYVIDRFRIERFGPDGTFLGQIGEQGSGDGQFENAGSIAIDDENNVYVTDSVNDDVQQFDRDLDFVDSWQHAGTMPGQNLEIPAAVATYRGEILVADAGTDRVNRYRSNGEWLGSWELPFAFSLEDMATDANGNVYAIDGLGAAIQMFTPQGTPTVSWDVPPEAVGLTVAPDGHVLIADSGNSRIQEFTATGTFVEQWGTAGDGPGQFTPADVATDCRGRVYISDFVSDRIVVYGLPGTPLPPCGSGSSPGGMSAILVLDSATNRYRATFTTTSETRGAIAQRGTVVRLTGVRAKGTFRGRLRRPAANMPSGLARFRAGTWRARLAATVDTRTGRGTARGWSLATSRNRRAGRVCLRFTTRFTLGPAGPRRLSGTFRSVGGTGAAARLAAGGRFKPKIAARRRVTLTGTGRAADGRPRKLPRACRPLLRAR